MSTTPLRIFHTADVHLGLKFSSHGEHQSALADARFRTLQGIVQRATTEHCPLLVVGGDLFESTTVAKRDVVRAAEILGAFEGAVVAVLPGNHDFFEGQEGGLWSTFRKAANDKVLLLNEQRPYDLAAYGLEGVCLYPAPCHDKHSPKNAMGWVKATPKDPAFAHHIGVAHGGLEGLSYDREGVYYPMTRQELLEAGVDFWLMGHIHVRHPVAADPQARIFYPGTPEPDGYDCSHEGTAWIIETQGRGGRTPQAVSTGHYRFSHEELEVGSLEDLRRLEERFAREDQSKRTLLKLKLKGHLSSDQYEGVGAALESLGRRLLQLKPDLDLLRLRITRTDIDAHYTQGSFPWRLLEELSRQEQDSEALQFAYELIQDVGGSTKGGRGR